MIIDFHTHYIPSDFPAKPAEIDEEAWPSLRHTENGATMFVGEAKFREFETLYWDVDQRIAAMDKAGVDVQVMSPLPELLSYWLAPEAAVILTDAMNRAGADMAGRSGGRLKAMGILALQDIDFTTRQVAQIAALGLSGIFMGSHVNGVSIASERFHPVLAEAERYGLAVFIHGIKPSGLERIEGPALMAAVVGVPYEGTTALTGFMITDIFARFPQLQIVFAHGGGMIGSVIDRMDLVWRKFPASMQGNLKELPSQYVRRFWFDTVVFSPESLAYLVTRLGADRIIAGSDGPTEIGQTDLPGFVAATGLADADCKAILGGNAARLLETTS